jgi:hypothetical protein
MKHAEVRQRLSAYLDGEVSEEERLLIEEHLGSCTECDSALKELTRTIRHVKDIEEVEPPPWMTRQIMARVKEEAGLKRGIFRRLFFPLHIKLPIEAVALVLVCLSAYLVYRTAEPQVRLGETPPVEEYGKELPKNVPPPATAPREKGRTSEKRGTESFPVLAPHRKSEKASDETRLPAPHPGPETVAPHREEVPSPAARKSESAPNARKMEQSPLSASTPKEARHPLPAAPADEERSGFESKSAGRQFESSAVGKRPAVSLKIEGADSVSAAREIEQEISRLGGRLIKTQASGKARTLTVLVDARKLPALLDKLRPLGNVKGTETQPPAAEEAGEVTVIIELVPETGK